MDRPGEFEDAECEKRDHDPLVLKVDLTTFPLFKFSSNRSRANFALNLATHFELHWCILAMEGFHAC